MESGERQDDIFFAGDKSGQSLADLGLHVTPEVLPVVDPVLDGGAEGQAGLPNLKGAGTLGDVLGVPEAYQMVRQERANRQMAASLFRRA